MMKLLSLFVLFTITFAAGSAGFAQTRLGSSGHEWPPFDPVKRYEGINKGWPERLTGIGFDQQKNYVVLVLNPPTKPLDLRTAEKFREAIIGTGSFGKTGISHAMVGWQCHQPSGELVRGITGLSGENSDQVKRMVLSGWGGTALISTFTDGDLQPSQDVGHYLDYLTGKGIKLGFVAVEIPAESCLNAVEFLHQFLFHENRPATKFGLMANPGKFEGGGCGSFAVTASDQTSFWPEVSTYFWREIQVPRRLMGWRGRAPENVVPYFPWDRSEDIIVPFPTFQDSSWEANGDETVSVRLVDPEMMLFSVRTLIEVVNAGLSAKRRLPVPERVVRSAVPIEGPVSGAKYYYRWTEIDSKFDAQAGALADAVRTWVRGKKDAGFALKPVNQNGLLGVKIERN